MPLPRPLAGLGLALLLIFAACDATEQRADASSFDAAVTGARTAELTGVASTNTYTFGMPRRQILLDGGEPGGNEGGVTFVRAYDTALAPGTFEVNPEAALGSGFSAILTLPRTPTPEDPSRAEYFYAFSGTLTLTEVTDDLARGTFSFRAGPNLGVTTPATSVEGSFVARTRD